MIHLSNNDTLIMIHLSNNDKYTYRIMIHLSNNDTLTRIMIHLIMIQLSNDTLVE